MRTLLLLALLAALPGCASTRPRASAARLSLSPSSTVAVLPFEDLSGRESAGEEFTRVFTAELVRTGALSVVEPGLVDEALERLSIRATRAMTEAEMRRLGDSLHVSHLLFGNILESGMLRTEDGEMPSVAAAVRLVDIASGRVVWACHHSRTGQDRETVFAWGRERSRERLLARLATEMMEDLRRAGASRSHQGGRTP